MTDTIDLSPYLLEKISTGEAVLFLGAGASYGALSASGKKPLNGNQLRDAICDKFFGGDLKDKPLAQVSEYAKYEASLFEVQNFIRSLFIDLQPSDFHKKIPDFRWHAIITTNYDLIIERSYEQSPKRLQQIKPILRDGDDFTDKLKVIDGVPYLKLHGCLSIVNEKELPLILASEEYARHRHNRNLLFSHFEEWARQHPIIFVGYDISDPNIQQILFDLGDNTVNRPKYVCVRPGMNKFDMQYWSARRFEPIKSTFEDFINYLDSTIPSNKRKLAILVDPNKSPICKWVSKSSPSSRLFSYIDNELTVVREDSAHESVQATDFYRGLKNGWQAFQNGFDCERKIADDIILDVVLEQLLDSSVRVFLVKGHAGSGKSVLLKRVAWEAAISHSQLVLFLEEGGCVRADLIVETCQITEEGVLLVVDDCLRHAGDIVRLIKLAENQNIALRILLGARTNEWNVYGEEFEKYLEKDYELRNLSQKEILSLLEKLESHKSLGTLEEISKDQRLEYFHLSAERQLLVALHEATQSKPFEDIVLNEYQNISTADARILYMDVCTLHRFGVGVRAGLVSRISGITYVQFESRLLSPLEHVVKVYFDAKSRDYAYRSRHQDIAKIIFENVLDDQTKRADQVIRIIRKMNIDFESDRIAFEQLIRGKKVAESFSNKELGDQIYDASIESGAEISYVEHQRAVYELNHPKGNPLVALKFIIDAEAKAKQGIKSIQHTKALVLRSMANASETELEKEKYRMEAKSILHRQIKKSRNAYPHVSLCQILEDEIKDKLSRWENDDSELASRVIEKMVADLEEVLYSGLQEFPADEYLLVRESEFAKILDDAPKALRALQKAFKSNPRSGFVAVRLSKMLSNKGDIEEAIGILQKALEENPHSKQVHLELAKQLIRSDEIQNHHQIVIHLRRSFSAGDTNYEGKFWYARQQFLYGERNEAKRTYLDLSDARMPPTIKHQVRGEWRDMQGGKKVFSGSIVNLHHGYCFVSSAEVGENVFIPRDAFSDDDWDALTTTTEIEFRIGFNLKGPIGTHPGILTR